MSNSAFSRQVTITSLYNSAANGMPEQDILSFFQLSPIGCPGIVEKIDPDCNISWYETQAQIAGQGANPTRGLWSRYLAENENKIAEFLGYWPGPKQITNEVHRVQAWTRFIKTKFCKVVRAGSRQLSKISDGLPQTFDITQSPFMPFQDLYRMTVGDLANPLVVTPECNFWLYPEGYGLQDEWALRPLDIESFEDGKLTLCAPLWTAIRPELFYVWPDEHGRIRRMCICEDNYISEFHLYQESYTLPHGYVRLATEYCPLCKGSNSATCDACNLPAIPICLQPRDWERGIFEFKPIVNTGTELDPCWEQLDSLEDCCQQILSQNTTPITARFMNQCYCSTPLDVEINYVSSCGGSWFDPCLVNDTCPELLRPLVDLSLADMINCNCGCLQDTITRLQEDMVRLADRTRVQNITQDMLKFGTRRGDIEAYIYLKNFSDKKKRSISYI